MTKINKKMLDIRTYTEYSLTFKIKNVPNYYGVTQGGHTQYGKQIPNKPFRIPKLIKSKKS